VGFGAERDPDLMQALGSSTVDHEGNWHLFQKREVAFDLQKIKGQSILSKR
jgi:hypothetical protein